MADFKGMAAQGWPDNLFAQTCTILSGASSSELINTAGKALVGIVMPATWTAAAIQYYASIDGSASGTHVVKDTTTANLMQTLVVADDWIAFPLADALFSPWIKLVSVTAASVTPVAQGGDRQIILLFHSFLN